MNKEWDSPLEGYYKNLKPEERYQQIVNDMQFVAPFFVEKNIKASRNIDYYLNNQWNPKELSYFRRQNRTPYVFNNIYTIVNNILGSYEQLKADVKLVPVGIEDEVLAAGLNELLKWFENVNNIDLIEKNVFRSGLLCGVGASQIRWSEYDILGGYPKLEYIPNDQLFWDISSTLQNLQDCRWMCRLIPLTKADAIELLPEFRKEIEENTTLHVNTPIPYVNALIDSISKLGRYYYISWRNYINDLRHYQWVIEHYERICSYLYVVCDHIFELPPEEFNSYQDALEYKNGVMQKALQESLPILDENGNDLVYIVKLKKDTYIQSIIFNNKLLSYEVVDIPSFPFQVYFPSFVDGDFISPVETLIPSQKFLNRVMSEWDNILIRGPKGIITVIEQKLAKGWTFEDVVNESSKTGTHIPVLSHDAIEQHQPPRIAPDFGQLYNIATVYMINNAGGQNIFGLQENAAESGRAVRARQAAAGLLRLPFFRNLEIWRKSVAEYAIWMIRNYMNDKFIARILNKYVDLRGQEFIESLREYRADVVIDTAVDSQITREAALESFKEFFQAMQGAIPPDVMISVLIELDPNITPEIKEKILSRLPIAQQQAEQTMEQSKTAQIIEQVTDSIKKKQITDLTQYLTSVLSNQNTMHNNSMSNGVPINQE
ncbi:MAG: hypothetical protein KatS3mg083_103 [Candidatus Dojkabacteria bacterium]|nr:MAG: hypothetical protein KatS3mg083_103 [Candidatus Dojkabacteria bacterium]